MSIHPKALYVQCRADLHRVQSLSSTESLPQYAQRVMSCPTGLMCDKPGAWHSNTQGFAQPTQACCLLSIELTNTLAHTFPTAAITEIACCMRFLGMAYTMRSPNILSLATRRVAVFLIRLAILGQSFGVKGRIFFADHLCLEHNPCVF